MAEETRKERYDRMMKEAEEGKAKADTTDFPKEEHPEYLAMEKGTPLLFRPMTFNYETNPKTPFDHRVFSFSFMKDDNGKLFPFKWGFDAWNKHPIYEIVKKVAKYDWDKATNTKTYVNEKCELLLDITKNGVLDQKYNNGWQPSKTLLMNVIDRRDNWCKENKHSKMLTSRAIFDEENDRWKTDYGFKISQYNAMRTQAEEEVGSLKDFDFLSLKYKEPKKVGDKDEYYKTLIAETKKAFIEENYGVEYTDAIFEGYDEVELGYDMYNLEEMEIYKPSSIGLFLSKKSKFVKAVDAKYNTNFFETLSKLATEERGSTSTEVVEESTTESKDVAKEAPKSTRGSVKESVEEPKGFDSSTLDPEEFKGISKLTETELAMITGVTPEGTLEFVEGALIEDCEKDHCKMGFPVDFKVCPYCSAEYN